MNGMLSIVQSITASDKEQLPTMFAMLDEHQSFRLKPNHELEPIVSHISNLLNDMSTKHQGLLLLNSFLPQCPLDIFEQKGALWIALCTKVCAQKKPEYSVTLAFEVLAKLLRKSVHVPEITKAISNTLLSKIIECTRSLPSGTHFGALKFLQLALSTYPGAAGITKITTEKYILSFVDNDDELLVTEAARCLQLLQQTRGGGTQNTVHKLAWSSLQLSLVGSVHELLDSIYTNTSEIVDAFAGTERLLLPDLLLSDEPVTRSLQLVRRFKNLCKYLQIALIEPFPVSKAVQPAKILGLISRGLAVNCATLSANLITDNIVVGALVPEIHVSLFRILDSLILILKSNMLMYGRQVGNLILQSLKWTSSGRSAGSKRPYSSIRRAAYHTLDLWCQTQSCSSGVEHLMEDLSQQILQDITPFQAEVTLKVMSGTKKHLSKKARRNLNRAQNDSTNLAQTHSTAFNAHNTKVIYTDEGNELLCADALRCLAHILVSTGSFLKPVMHKLLQEHIVQLAIAVLEAPTLKSNLYALPECRFHLYGVLYALVTAAHNLCPPPLQYAVTILTLAQVRDTNPRVRENCALYLRNVEKILHPQKETPYFMAELAEVRDALKDLRQLKNKSVAADDVEEESDEEMLENISVSHPVNGKETVARPVAERELSPSPIVFTSDVLASANNDDDDDDVEILSAPIIKATTDSSPKELAASNFQPPSIGAKIPNEPQIIWTEDLDDDDTLAVSDDDEPPSKNGNEVIVIVDDALPVPGDKRRTTKGTINISDDEDVEAVAAAKRSKLNDETIVGDEDDIVANVLATFDDEINEHFKL